MRSKGGTLILRVGGLKEKKDTGVLSLPLHRRKVILGPADQGGHLQAKEGRPAKKPVLLVPQSGTFSSHCDRK